MYEIVFGGAHVICIVYDGTSQRSFEVLFAIDTTLSLVEHFVLIFCRLGMSSVQRKDYDYHFKCILVGDSRVGKTSILFRFVDDSFAESCTSTIGIDFVGFQCCFGHLFHFFLKRFKKIEVDGDVVKLQIVNFPQFSTFL
jgi:GTPase SAR1 family protein